MAADEKDLKRMEYELLCEKAADAYAAFSGKQLLIQEGAWTGSMGGHDPDQLKMKNGLMEWWRKKARTDPHPFAYCVRHLQKKFPNPERICAWLKDQALGRTNWRHHEANGGEEYSPTLAELKLILETLEEADRELEADNIHSQEAKATSGSEGEITEITFTATGQREFHFANGTTIIED